jgi:phage regulator Rha-like protein
MQSVATHAQCTGDCGLFNAQNKALSQHRSCHFKLIKFGRMAQVKQAVTSTQTAQHFGKRHDTVLRAIDNLEWS